MRTTESPVLVITGANGFIGTNLVDRALKLAREDIGLAVSGGATTGAASGGSGSKFRDEWRDSPELQLITSDLAGTMARSNAQRFAGSRRITFVPHDRLVEHLRSLPAPPVAVLHNGACSSTTETDPEVFRTLNLEASKELFIYCAERGVPFLYASSASVYGDGTAGFSEARAEMTKFRPLNLYARSKYDFDVWAMSQAVAPPAWAGLRYFNVYGPFEAHKGGQASMVYHSYQQILRTGRVRLFQSNSPDFRDGEQLRDFVYVGDVVQTSVDLLRLCLTGRFKGGVFANVGTGESRTFNALAESVFAALRVKPQIEYIPMPETLSRQYQNYTCAELSTLASLGIPPLATPLERGVETYVTKYLTRGL